MNTELSVTQHHVLGSTHVVSVASTFFLLSSPCMKGHGLSSHSSAMDTELFLVFDDGGWSSGSPVTRVWVSTRFHFSRVNIYGWDSEPCANSELSFIRNGRLLLRVAVPFCTGQRARAPVTPKLRQHPALLEFSHSSSCVTAPSLTLHLCLHLYCPNGYRCLFTIYTSYHRSFAHF